MKDKTTSSRTYGIVVPGEQLNARLLSEILSTVPNDTVIWGVAEDERGWRVDLESAQFTDFEAKGKIRPLNVVSSREEMFEELEAFAYDAA